jgi:aryl-alcohol dehydrogenase-like predicted oxidoreductase
MKQVPLGHTGIEVSAMCLGTMYFGSLTSEAIAFDILDAYAEAGGAFLDTANIYAGWLPGFVGGESETLIGKWLRERDNRQQMFVATKVGGILHRGHEELPESKPGLSAQQIEADCEDSLRRLGVATIDLYYAHVDDRQTPLEETLEVFDRLVKAGKVRFIGASNIRAWRLERAYWVAKQGGWHKYCCVQARYSYLQPRPDVSFSPQLAANEELVDCCRSTGVTLLAYSPLLGGGYADEEQLPEAYRSADSAARLNTLREVAAEQGVTVHQVVLAWLCQNAPPVIPVMGVETVAQLRENLGSVNILLSAEQLSRLNSAGL